MDLQCNKRDEDITMTTKKRRSTDKHKGTNRRKAVRKARAGAPKKMARTKGKSLAAHSPKQSIGTPGTSVAVYEIIETEIYREPDLETGGPEGDSEI
jgi:hypothetical protein